MRSVRYLVLMVFLLPLVNGCIPKPVILEEGPLRTATLAELITLQEERTQAIQTVRALLSVHPEGGRSFTASLRFVRDSGNGSPGITVQGFDLLGRTVFELNSVNGDYNIRVGRKGRMAELDPESLEIKRLPVSPKVLLRMVSALVGPVMTPEDTPVFESRGRFYLIHLVRMSGKEGRLVRRLWIDRRNLSLTRVEVFSGGNPGTGSGAGPTVVIDLEENQILETADKKQVSWPRRVRVGPIISEFQETPGVELEFKEVHLNEGRKPGAVFSRQGEDEVK